MNENRHELPAWMAQPQEYAPQRDREAFIHKSTSAVLGALARLKGRSGRDGRFAASPGLKVLYTLLFIILTACSRNLMFTLCMLAGVLVATALQPAATVRTVFRDALLASAVSALILLPSVFMDSPGTLLTIVPKVFVSASLVALLSAGTSWNRLTSGLRLFFVPDLFLFTLDITIKYIALLGDICLEVLTALRLRSVGRDPDKAGALSGVLGITFVRSREMSEEMYAAMCCRGFTGSYERPRRLKPRAIDALYLIPIAAAIAAFLYLG